MLYSAALPRPIPLNSANFHMAVGPALLPPKTAMGSAAGLSETLGLQVRSPPSPLLWPWTGMGVAKAAALCCVQLLQ
jgi:hypothetical protein